MNSVEIETNPASPTWQFLKYAVLGMTAVGLRVLLYFFFSQWWPSSDHLSASIGETGRAWNHFYANASAVVVTNIFGYVTNVLWVFQGGRHSRLMEFLLFSTVTFSCLILGALFGPLMMAFFGISEKLSLFAFILVSTGANFYIRKNWVFRC